MTAAIDTNTKTDFHSLHFPSIQALRGVAAVLIVLEHIRFLNCGAFGVDIFFCISGFMIMFTTHKNTSHYFTKRFIRILPFYYGMTLGTYALLLLFPQMFEQTSPRLSYLVKSLLFIPFDMGGGVIQPLLRIGWTLNCEMFFYLLFGISLRLGAAFPSGHQYRGIICSTALSFFVLLAQILPINRAPLTFYGNPVMLDFALGILAYYIVQKLYVLYNAGKINRTVSLLSLLLALFLLLVLVLSRHHINVLGFRRLFLWSIPAFLIVIAVFIAGFHLTMPAWSVRLGDISFSLYLIHYYPILFIDRKICDFSRASFASVTGAFLSLLLVVFLSYISWFLIEKKLTGWLKSHLIPSTAVPPYPHI